MFSPRSGKCGNVSRERIMCHLTRLEIFLEICKLEIFHRRELHNRGSCKSSLKPLVHDITMVPWVLRGTSIGNNVELSDEYNYSLL